LINTDLANHDEILRDCNYFI